MSVLATQIAGLRVDLRLNGPAPADLARYAPFEGAAGPAALTLDLTPGPLEGLGRFTGRIVAAGGRWRVEGAEHLGWLDPASGHGEAVADPSLVILDALVRAVLARSVGARGGILVHAAALRVDGRAHLCPGRSGAGKSTLAARAGHALTDELSAVVPAPGGFTVHGTPWWSSAGGEAPLAAVHALAWDEASIAPLPHPALLRHLATNLVLPLDGPEERARAFATCGAIAAAVPFSRLSFRPDTDVDALLRRPAVPRAA